MNKLHFAVFFAVFFSVYFGMHYFVYTRVANGLMLAGGIRTGLRLFFIVASLSFATTQFLTRHGSAPWLRPVGEAGYVWLGVLSIALSLLVITELLKILFRGQPFNYYSTLAALFLLAIASVYSLYNVASGPALKEITIKTGKLPRGTEKLTIVQLSDMHVDMLTSPKWLENVVERTNALEPDIVLITGDLIDSEICLNPVLCGTLRTLKSRYGVFAVSGNHEYYTGMDVFYRTAEGAGFRIIDGMKVSAAGINLIGISDRVSEKKEKAESDIRSVLAWPDERPGMFSVLLSHRPDTFDAASSLGIDLQLSGHTHAGQIPPMDLLVYLSYKYPWGFFKKGDSCLYCTTGTGIWGPPMRLFSRSEIVKITLLRG